MNHDMLVRGMRLFHLRRPFRPYHIEFVSGDRITVKSSEFIAPFDDLFLFSTPGVDQRIFDASSVAQLIDTPRSTSGAAS